MEAASAHCSHVADVLAVAVAVRRQVHHRCAPSCAGTLGFRVCCRLMGQRTVVVATGIGPVAAALCTLELLVCGRWINEIVYVGTSGWSPQRGGVLSVQPYHGQVRATTAISAAWWSTL
jgi:nucleoside phosphorylase